MQYLKDMKSSCSSVKGRTEGFQHLASTGWILTPEKPATFPNGGLSTRRRTIEREKQTNANMKTKRGENIGELLSSFIVFVLYHDIFIIYLSTRRYRATAPHT